jgi:peptidyl-prolyl cis-trans isomerase D
MAVIGKIRSYSGLLIAVIGIALAAFVLGDFMGYGPTGAQNLEVGEVGNNKIMYPEFENRVAQQLENWRQQTGNQNVGQREAFQIRQQVWNQMLRELLLSEEFESLGLKISPDELTDLVIGRNPHPSIIQSFSNPQDGSFDPQMVIEFIQNLDNMEPSMQQQWFMLEEFIKQQRKETKYHTLISKAWYAPEMLVSFDYQNKNATADIKVALRRYTEIADSLVTVTDRDLRNTYNDHKSQFKREKSRDLEYVVFPVFPSEQDREYIRQETENLKTELETTENVESFINANSDVRFNPRYSGRGELSPEIDDWAFDAEVGDIIGPYEENNAFVVTKLHDVEFRPDSMRASHILIAHRTSMSAGPETTLTREEAEQKADSLLNVVRRAPGRFAELAVELSDDPSAFTNQGDLGWFSDGDMVQPFNEAVINTPVNSFTVAESDFGFHVIRVTGKSAPTKKVQVAQLVRNIEYSNQTYQRVYGQASAFASMLRDNKDFDEAANEEGLSKRVVDNIRPMDNAIPGIDNPRGIIQWAFAENTEKGDHSQIFDLDGRFVIARVTEVREEGIPQLDDIRDEIRDIAVHEKKAEMIINEFNQAQGNDLETIANELGVEAQLVENIRFNQSNLQGFGNEPAVIGSAFALEPGESPKPVKGNAGVYFVEVLEKVEAVEPQTLANQQTQLKNAFRNRVPNEAFRALEQSADVEDNRHRFY